MRKLANRSEEVPDSTNRSETKLMKKPSKARNWFKQIFSRKLSSSKKSRHEKCVSKSLNQPSSNTPCIPEERTFQINSRNSNGSCRDFCSIEPQPVDLVHKKSFPSESSFRTSHKDVPSILEDTLPLGNDTLPFDVATGNCMGHTADRYSKSSDNDSAVDMKFHDYTSDQSETNGSRDTPLSLVDTNSHGLQKTETLKIFKSTAIKRNDSTSSWRKLRAALVWTPFIQHYARNRYPWIQIAGHQGNFKPGEHGTILKKHTGRESICLQIMCEDTLSDFVPEFKGNVDYEGERYICMQDLLAQFSMPSCMDIKMGTRTYLEEELSKAQCSPKPRQDMYEKMIEVDKDEPTEEEHTLRAVIKSRYMQWRETLSSTVTLGFRIEGVKKNVGTQSRNFKRTKYRHEVKEALLDFMDNNADLLRSFIQRIESLRSYLEKSAFFWDHEFIGSSLLFVYDKSGKANVWMIDFGKTIPLPPKCRVTHVSPWIEGNHEDGYFFGLENLLTLLEEIHSETFNDSS